MPTSKKSSEKSANAVELLIDDHKRVKKLFKEFDKIKEKGDAGEKEALVEEICAELILHTQVEEEIFYPAAREALKDDDMLNEAEVEHASAKDLIEQIRVLDSSDPMYDAKVTVLGEYIEHHVGEEEDEMFPKAKKAKMDLEALGEEILAMKESNQNSLLASQNKSGRSKNSSARH